MIDLPTLRARRCRWVAQVFRPTPAKRFGLSARPYMTTLASLISTATLDDFSRALDSQELAALAPHRCLSNIGAIERERAVNH